MLGKTKRPLAEQAKRGQRTKQDEWEGQEALLAVMTGLPRGEQEVQDGMLAVIAKHLPGLRCAANGRALETAQKACHHYRMERKRLGGQPTIKRERAKLAGLQRHVEGLLAYLQEPAVFPMTNEDGEITAMEVFPENSSLLYEAIRANLDESLHALSEERLDLFELNQVLRFLRSWVQDTQNLLAFKGKPKAGSAEAKPQRDFIWALMDVWEMTTGQSTRDGYMGKGRNHNSFSGTLFDLILECLDKAGDKPSGQGMLGKKMDTIRRLRTKKGVNLTAG